MIVIELAISTSDWNISIVNKWIEGYLKNYVAWKHSTWITWPHLGEYCYNTTHNLSIKMTPFKALYGYEALNFADLDFGDIMEPKDKYLVQES